MKKILKGKFRKLRLTFNRVARIIEENRHIFDIYVLFTAFSKSLDPLVAKMVKVSKEHLETNIPKDHKTVSRILRQQQRYRKLLEF